MKETKREERRHTATQRRRHVSGIDLRHEVAVGKNHHGEGALRYHHRQGEPQQLGRGLSTEITTPEFGKQLRHWWGAPAKRPSIENFVLFEKDKLPTLLPG